MIPKATESTVFGIPRNPLSLQHRGRWLEALGSGDERCRVWTHNEPASYYNLSVNPAVTGKSFASGNVKDHDGSIFYMM